MTWGQVETDDKLGLFSTHTHANMKLPCKKANVLPLCLQAAINSGDVLFWVSVQPQNGEAMQTLWAMQQPCCQY